MYRSFTDRVLGGVCGGLAAVLPIGVWWLRGLFALLAVVTLGAWVLLYLGLWLALPQQSPVGRQRGGSGLLLLALLAIFLTLAGWGAWMVTGTPVYWPALLVGVTLVFFVRQVRG
jgi:phage shock protein PspC (stress-responsive transcriptional regulator)